MRTVISFIYCLLSLAGCMDGPGTTVVARASANGVDTLFSRTEVEGGRARFECLRSASGRCHYAVFAQRCSSTTSAGTVGTQCSTEQVEAFELAVGRSRELGGLGEDFRQCVSHRPGAMNPDCSPRA